MTRRRKILFVVCLLVLLAALPLAAMLLLPWDATPPDDADLLIQRDAIPDAENGYALFEEAAARAFLPRGEDETAKIDAALGNEGWDDEFINGLVSKNQAALDLSESRVSQMHSAIIERLRSQLEGRSFEFAAPEA